MTERDRYTEFNRKMQMERQGEGDGERERNGRGGELESRQGLPADPPPPWQGSGEPRSNAHARMRVRKAAALPASTACARSRRMAATSRCCDGSGAHFAAARNTSVCNTVADLGDIVECLAAIVAHAAARRAPNLGQILGQWGGAVGELRCRRESLCVTETVDSR